MQQTKTRQITQNLLYHFFAIFKDSRPVTVETESRDSIYANCDYRDVRL